MVTTARAPPELRAYRSPDDIEATFGVFQAAIRQTAAAVYGPDQVEAWAGPASPDLSSWDARRRRASTLVAVVDDQVVGFTDLLPDGLVDMLFVHPRAGGRGVARALLTAVKVEARTRRDHRAADPGQSERSTRVRTSRVHARRRSPGQHGRGVVVPNAEMRCLL